MRENERGGALTIVLGTLVVVGLLITTLAMYVQAPLWMLGKMGRAETEVMAAESTLEQGRAMLMNDPSFSVVVPGMELVWDRSDSCLASVSAFSGDLAVHESWVVESPTRFLIYSDSVVKVAPGVSLEGSIFARGRDTSVCAPFVFDTGVIEALRPRRIVSKSIEGMEISFEAVVITSPDTGAVELRDVSIRNGCLIVEGDAVLSGSFEGKARDGWPLLVVTGELRTEVHVEKWQWEGVVSAGKDAFVAGPLEFTGTFVGEAVEFFGEVLGRHRYEKGAVVGFEPRVRRVSRVEQRL